MLPTVMPGDALLLGLCCGVVIAFNAGGRNWGLTNAVSQIEVGITCNKQIEKFGVTCSK